MFLEGGCVFLNTKKSEKFVWKDTREPNYSIDNFVLRKKLCIFAV